MKKILLALLTLISITCFSQTTGHLRYDSVRIYKVGGNSNLIIENATRDSLGFLYNYGNGRTRFDVIRAVTGGIKVGDDTIIVNTSCEDGVVFGRTVSWEGGFRFHVQEGIVRIDCQLYSLDSVTLTLDSADTDDRFDVIYDDVDGAHVLEGVPATNAAIPQVQGGQIHLTAILIEGGAPNPSVSSVNVYFENDATITPTGTTAVGNSTVGPFAGTFHIRITTINNGDIIDIIKPSGTWDISGQDALVIHIKNRAQVPQLANLRVSLWNGASTGSQVSGEVILNYNKNFTTAYQAIAIPMAAFGSITNTNIDRVRLRFTSNNANNFTGYDLDNIFFEDGVQQPGNGGTGQFTLNTPSSMTLTPTNTILTNSSTYTLGFNGSSTQYIRGDGSLATFNAITGVGTFNTVTASNNGAEVSGTDIFFHPVSATVNGMATPTMKEKWDSIYYAENMSSLGDSMMVSIAVDRIGFKSLVAGANITITPTDSTLIIASTGGGGGGWDDMLAPLQVQTADRQIDQSTFNLFWEGSQATTMVQMQNTGAGEVLNLLGNSGVGLTSKSSSNYAIHAETLNPSTTAAARLLKDKTTSNSVEPILDLVRFTESNPDTVATNGIGGSIDYWTENSADVLERSTRLISEYSDVTDGSEDSKFRIQNQVAGTITNVFTVGVAGQLQLAAGYPANTFTGTATFDLGIDASGNVITTATGGGSGVTTVDAFNTTPNAFGLTITGTGIALNRASGTQPGGIIVGGGLGMTGAGVLSSQSRVKLNGGITTYQADIVNIIGTGITVGIGGGGHVDIDFTGFTGGGGADGNFAEDDLTFDANRAHDLAGFTLAINEGANSFLSIDPTVDDESIFIQAYNITGSESFSRVRANAANDEVSINILGAFNGFVKSFEIAGFADATTSTLEYEADTHTFTGDIIMNAATSGTITLKSDALSNAINSTTLSGTGFTPSTMFARSTADFTLANSSSDQTAFPSTIDVWTLQGATTYFFEGEYNITSGAVSHSVAMGFALAGGATITSIYYSTLCHSGTINAQSPSQNTTAINQVATTVVNAAGAVVTQYIKFSGWISMNAGGTVTPQIKFSADPTGTCLMKAGSYIRFTPAGTNTIESIGNVQ